MRIRECVECCFVVRKRDREKGGRNACSGNGPKGRERERVGKMEAGVSMDDKEGDEDGIE